MIPLILCTILSPLLTPPPDVAATIRQLGAESWSDREAAHRSLSSMGDRALPALRAAAASPDPEIAARARALLADDEIRFLESMAAIHGGQWPCVDSLLWRGCYRETEWLAVVELYRPYCDGSAPEYPGYRAATVALVLDLRRAGTPDCALRLLVRKMVSIEHDIPVSSGGRRVAEPIPAPEAPE